MQISTEMLIMLFMLMIAITFGHFLKKSGHKYLQEAGLTTLLGLAAGGALRLMHMEQYVADLTTHFTSLFLILLLPPIIFESGYNMKKKPFFKNIGAIMAYSFIGTFIAIFASSAMFYLAGKICDPPFTWKDAFAFGALISATDPVSCLAIFKEMDADQNLNAIVFGESIFNDAIAIVMYSAVMSTQATSMTVGEQISDTMGFFCLVFGGSLLIGIITALLIAFIMKRQAAYKNESIVANSTLNKRQVEAQTEHNVMTEVSMMLMCPYVSYLMAEGLELSGIVAILINGIFLSYYATPNLSEQSRKVLHMAYETIAFSTETLVFLFLGMGIFAFAQPYNEISLLFITLTIFNLFLARALNISIVTWLVNLGRSKESKIGKNVQFVMWIAGLRGAMAYALALKSSSELTIGKEILTDTLVFSLLTILVIGTFLNPILSKLDVKQQDDDRMKNMDSNQVLGNQTNCFNKFKRVVRDFDSLYFSPLFIK